MVVEAAPDVVPFEERASGDFISTITIAMAALGDRLGLFATLSTNGPLTSQEMADAAGVNERYAREWLSGMACAGYLEHEPQSGRFTLPKDHATLLADEGGPSFMGGLLQQTPAIFAAFDHVAEAFRGGGGVHQAEYHQGFWEGMQRDSAGLFNHLLVQEWIPAVPDLQRLLEQGALVADIGCGSGLALIRLAEAFPASRFVGYDNFPAQIGRATANVASANLSDRIRIESRSADDGLPETYDVITSFDVVHDASHPARLLGAIRQALNPGGRYVMLEPAAGETLEENYGPVGAFLYGASIFYCMTTSLAEGGEGLGTAGLPESKVHALATEAGFEEVRRIPIEHPLYALYELRA